MSTTDDLLALGCGAAVGKVFFWGLILTVGFVLMHPWVLLIGLGIWWLVKKYGTEATTPPSTGGSGRVAEAPTASHGSTRPRDANPRQGNTIRRPPDGTRPQPSP